MKFKKLKSQSAKSLLSQISSYSNETLELERIRYESLLERSKFANVMISVGAIVVTLMVLTVNIGISKNQLADTNVFPAILIFEIIILIYSQHLMRMVELNTRFLKVYEYEIDPRAKEKEMKEKEEEKLHLEKQTLVEKREKILNQKYRK